MGILGDLERLINEHASAAVLKERIALAEDKYASLERKLKELSEENAKLRAENADLASKIPAAAPAPQVEELGDRLLVLLSQRADVPVPHIARALGISNELAEFHIEELENANFVSGSYSAMAPPTYRLAQEGRRHLLKKGLLK